MPDPGASAGEVHVDVLPNVDRFATELRAKLASLPNVKVACLPDTSGFRTALRTQLASLPTTRIKVSPDTTAFRTALRTTLAALPPTSVKVSPDTSRFRTDLITRLATMRPVGVSVTPDTARFRTQLATELATLRPVGVPVRPDTTTFRGDLRARLAAITGLKVRIEADLTASSVATLRATLAGVTAPTITITVDITDALANIATLQVALNGITAPTVNADVDITAAMTRVAALQAALTGLHSPTVSPHIGGNAGAAGARDAGAYGNALRAGLAAVQATLRPISVGVASSPAEQAIRDIHQSLQRLSTERVGVTVTAGQARAEITNLREDITRLRAASPLDIDVDADLGAAELRLAQLERELDAVGRDREVNVRVDDGGSINRMQLLVSAIVAIGPAAIPAAAGATAAIVAIGNAAIASVAGIGVAVLALSGIGGAVKLLNTAHADQLKQQAGLARQDKQLAGGADQVRSAVASLANTQANAARSVANAERDVTRAKRDALDAEADLTRARQDAVEALQDLDSQINHNADSILRANLELADAEKALAAVQNLPADNRRRVEAQAAYNEARHQLDDLTLRQGRLAAEKAAADKAGVDGSKQVVAAQRQVADSQERVRDAEAGLADARRQAAYSIAQAQQAVVSAQRSAATSAVTAAATAGGAADELRAKLLSLSPEGQRFAEFLVSAKDRGLELRRAAEAGFLPGFQRGIEALLADGPALEGFISRVATGMGNITERQLRAFSGNEWRPFFSYIGSTAVPTLDALTRSANNVALGFGNIIVGFAPFTRDFNGGMVGMTERFAVWSAALDRNQGFKNFVSYAQQRGPETLNTINEVLGAVLHILQAAAPYGDVVLATLRGVATAVDAIPLPILTAAVAAFAGFRVAGLVTVGVVALTRAMVGMAVGAAGGQAAAAGMASTIAGPLTAAIIVATLAFTFMAQKQADAKAKANQLKDAYQQYGEALKDGVNPATADNVRTMLAQSDGLRGLIAFTDRAGIAQKTLIDGLNGDRAAREQVVAAFNKQIDSERRAAEERLGWGANLNAQEKAEGEAHQRNAENLQKQRDAFVASSRAAEEATAATQALTAATVAHGRAAADLQPKIAAQQKLLEALTSTTATAAQISDAYRQAIDAYTGAAQNAIEAEERMVAAQDAATAALKRSNGELDISKGKTAEQRQAILAARDALEEQLRASREAMLADIARGTSLDEARKKQEARIAAILNEIPANQRNSKAVQDLVAAYGAIPPEVATSLKLTGAAAVLEQLKNLKIAQLALDRNMTIPDATAVINGNQGRVFAASGGYISGPGGPRDDRIPAMLSNGEFVQQAAAVDYYGPQLMAALNQRKIPKQLLPMYAAGGLVDWPYNVDVTDTDVPTLAQIKAKLFGAGPGFGNWPSSPSAQRGDSGVWRSIVALLNSSGIPWKFGNAYRPGDPLWHGSGRAIDVMGYQQDALASFLAARHPLELIHRTSQRDYAYTRGKDKGSFNNSLMEAHRNHIHIAMCDGGLVDEHHHNTWAGLSPIPTATYDTGGVLPPGATLAYNGTGRDEYVHTGEQLRELATTNTDPKTRGGVTMHIETFNANAADPYATAYELDWIARGLG